MKFYQLALRYLRRKKSKTFLLFFVLLLVNTMLLSICMILRATEDSMRSMQAKTSSKIIAEVSDVNAGITDTEAEQIRNLPDVGFVNRIGRYEAFPSGFTPVTASASTEEDNRKAALLSYDDLEKDSPFSELQYHLTSGKYINEHTKGAVIHDSLAAQNGLQIGDKLELTSGNGAAVSVPITGLFRSAGRIEEKQPTSAAAVNRIENQIFLDNETCKELQKDSSFYQLSIYTENPENMDALQNQVQEILGGKADIRTSDALYRQMSAPLEQISRTAKLMLILTLSAGTIIVSLLLCMWVRTRRREMAVFLSLGKKKRQILLQVFCESGIVFLLSVLAASLAGNGIRSFLQNMISGPETADTGLTVLLGIRDIGALAGLGSILVFIALRVSLIPALRANPKDILARMEE